MGECLNGSWIDYGAQNPPGGGEVIPASDQRFTSNGTFIAPYDGIYTVVLSAGHAKSGSGGSGSGANRNTGYGYGGGAGGSAYIAQSPGIILVQLAAGEQVTVTVNNSVCSFGSYASFSTGTSGGDGGDGSSSGRVGSGGAGGSAPSFSCNQSSGKIIWYQWPSLPSRSLSGSSGNKTSSVEMSGGLSASAFGLSGQNGGCGDFEDWDGYDGNMFTSPIGRSYAAEAGTIQIIWGTSKGG